MRLLTLREVLDVTGIARASLYRYRDRGTFPTPVRIGNARVVLFAESDINDWMRANGIRRRCTR